MDRRFALLRVLACFMVVQLHVAAELYRDYSHPGWWAGNVYDSLVRCSVPLFFMLAGATLLRRDEPLAVFFRKRAVRVLPPLVFWSVFYLWWLWHNGGGPANWVAAILAGPTMFHLWFFYALVGLYAAVPLLRKFYLHSPRRDHLGFVAIWFLVAAVLPVVRDSWKGPHCEGGMPPGALESVYHLHYFAGYAGFLVLGAVLADRPLGRRAAAALFALGSLGTMAASAWLSRRHGAACEYFFVYLSPLVVLAACGLFSLAMHARAGEASPWLARLSDCTLGIYGLHVFVIDPVFMRRGLVATAGPAWLSPLLVAAGVFATALAVVALVRTFKPARWVV